MNPQKLQFLNLRNLPARLTAEETSWLLGFNPHDIPILIATGLLLPRSLFSNLIAYLSDCPDTTKRCLCGIFDNNFS